MLEKNQIQTIESYDRTARQFTDSIARLTNYDHTYDAMADLLEEGDLLLDMACGPAQISRYIRNRKTVRVAGVDLSSEMLSIAQENIPDGRFYKSSILDFQEGGLYDAVIIGFGLPYLDRQQAADCIANAVSLLKPHKHLYISFMHGEHSGFEKTSFGREHEFFIYYHPKDYIRRLLQQNGLNIIREFELDYQESDGSITEDVIYISEKVM